jgi:2-polyprenyl-6-methoxyphenol hydroxylase-like FAD-dependent oxidoreductase
MSTTQVVVVGAGPVGLMLAAELRLGGAEVVVLERRATPGTESRASTLHARTMEILDSRGLLDRLGDPSVEPRGHFGGIGLGITQWKVPQTRTEELLGEWATELGADLRRGHEVHRLSTTDGHVEVEALGPAGPVSLRARYVVGCDGERSTVRRLTGAEFPGEDARRELLRADVAGIRVPDRRFERLADGLAIASRRADGVTRVMVHEFGTPPRAAEPAFSDVADAWKRVTGEDIRGGTPLWVNAFGDANRLLTRYRHGRVLFAGDAAHRCLPAGGQALNLGLQDAVNLGWKLAMVVGGTASEDLLDSYHTERHAVARRVLGNIRAQAWLLLGGPDVEPVRAIVGELVALDEVRAHLAAMISGLDVRYEVGDGDHPLLGVRMPPVELMTEAGPTTTAALLRTGRGVLLNLSGNGAALSEVARPWQRRVDTVTAQAAPEVVPGLDSVLVRPDGHVAWAGAARRGLTTALRRWFGRPEAHTETEVPCHSSRRTTAT